MPFKKRRGLKKVYKKYNKRYPKQRKIAQYVNPVKRGGFPDSYFSPLTYTAQGLGMGDNTQVAYQRVVTLNDPTNGNAILPLGWTLLREIYDTCLVHMAKIKLVFQNTSATIPCRLVIAPVDPDSANLTSGNTAITSTVFNYLCQSPYAKVYNLSALGGGKDTVTLKCSVKVAKYAGEGKKLDARNDRFLLNCGGSNSSRAFTAPTALYRWFYAVCTSTNANLGTNQVYVSSELTYYCQFLERLAAAL